MAIKINLDRVMFESGNMKIPELQQKTGLNKNTLYSFYKGEVTRIDLKTLDAICEALECEPGDLLKRLEDGEKSK